jgi:hypothetical protein
MGYDPVTCTLIAKFESSYAALLAARDLSGIGLPKQDIFIASGEGAILHAVVSSNISDSAVEILNRHGADNIETRSEGVAELPGIASSLGVPPGSPNHVEHRTTDLL